MAKLDHDWYERAADVIANENSTTAARLAVLNELWREYSLVANFELTVDWVREMVDSRLSTATGYTLKEVIEFAKEKIANGTNETHEAATDTE